MKTTTGKKKVKKRVVESNYATTAENFMGFESYETQLLALASKVLPKMETVFDRLLERTDLEIENLKLQNAFFKQLAPLNDLLIQKFADKK